MSGPDWMENEPEHQPLVDAITDRAQVRRERPGDFMFDRAMNDDDEPVIEAHAESGEAEEERLSDVDLRVEEVE